MRFTDRSIDLFVRASHDANPLHTDQAYARRTPFGHVVVHGVAVVLALLGAGSGGRPLALRRLHAEFRRPVIVGPDHAVDVEPREDEVVVCLGHPSDPRVRVSFVRGAAPSAADATISPDTWSPRARAADLDAAQVEAMDVVTLEGYACDPDALADLAGDLGLPAGSDMGQVGTLLACSYVSGMICPGRQGLLSQLNVDFAATEGTAGARCDVRYDPRFRLVTMTGTIGADRVRIAAFLRPGPVPLPIDAGDGAPQRSDRFRGRAVLVTGSSRGFGAALAVAFARAGADLVLNGREATEELESMRRGLVDMGASAVSVAADVLTPEGCERLARAVAETYGRLDVLVCAAAPVVEPMPLAEIGDAELLGSVSATLRAISGPLRAVQPLLSDRALVVFVSSRWVVDPPAGFSHYVVGKSAGEALLRAAAIELRHARFVVARPPRMLTDQTNPIADLRPLARPGDVAAALVDRLGALSAEDAYVELTL